MNAEAHCGHTPKEEMAAWDLLPKRLRDALSRSPLGCCAVEVQEALVWSSVREILQRLHNAERQITGRAA